MKDVLIVGANGAIGTVVAHSLNPYDFKLWMATRKHDSADSLIATCRNAVKCTDDTDSYGVHGSYSGFIDSFLHNAEFPAAIVWCAGNIGRIGPTEKYRDSYFDFEEAVLANLIDPILSAAEFASFLHTREWRGDFIVFSGAGVGGESPGSSMIPYASSKAALVYAVEALAEEKPWLRINAVAPGRIYTKMTEKIFEAGPELAGKHYEQAKRLREDGGSSLAAVGKTVRWLLMENREGITGRLISAQHDRPEKIHEYEDSFYKLRRRDMGGR